MKKILIFLSLIFLISFFISPRNLFAIETASSSAAVKYNIVFPIASLGNCNSIAECKTFCDNPVNLQACHTFASSKDLYKVNPVAVAAKAELGCDVSTSSCKEVCAKQENFSKCKAFGEKYYKNIKPKEQEDNLKIASKSATPVVINKEIVCADFCASHPEACKPKNLPLGKYAQLENVCRSSGCSWSNFSCTCPKPKTSATTISSTSGETRALPVVQGASIGPDLFQRILQFLQGK